MNGYKLVYGMMNIESSWRNQGDRRDGPTAQLHVVKNDYINKAVKQSNCLLSVGFHQSDVNN